MLYFIFVIPLNLILPFGLRFFNRKPLSKIFAIVLIPINLVVVMALLILIFERMGWAENTTAIIIGCGIAVPLVYQILVENKQKEIK